jgi:hypothetical protein
MKMSKACQAQNDTFPAFPAGTESEVHFFMRVTNLTV